MRKHPILKELPTSRDYIDTFGGYNHNLRIGANEFYDMKNLSSDNYPMVSTRNKRTTKNIPHFDNGHLHLVGMISKNNLHIIYLDSLNSTLYMTCNGEVWYEIGKTKENYDAQVKRQVVSIGVYICIFPDKLYYDSTNLFSLNAPVGKSLEVTCEIPMGEEVIYKLSDGDGNSISVSDDCFFHSNLKNPTSFLAEKVESGEADNILGPLNNCYCCDSNKGIFYYWNAESKMWLTQEIFVGVYSNYVDFEEYFKVGDAVRLSGILGHDFFEEGYSLTSYIINCFVKNGVGSGIVLNCHPVHPTVCEFKSTYSETIRQIVPDMDFVIENNNRLWGCRYGKNRYGEIVNEIYASALGDFTSWERFGGTSQDSYTLSLGSEGAFTGAISYLGNPVFFKNNCIHTILGNYPATYQLQTIECKGVQNGCEGSLAIIDGVLFYRSLGGISAYTGSFPTEIGLSLNERGLQFDEAIADGYNKKYYIAMHDINVADKSKKTLFVYDTTKGLWHKEADIEADYLIYHYSAYENLDNLFFAKNLHAINQIDSEKNALSSGAFTYDTKEDSVPWFAETGIITCSTPDKKYISKMSFRMSMDVGTRVYVSIEYNSSGVWEQVAAITGTTLNAFTFPVKPKRCDHFRLKIEGTDSAKIYSISKTIEQGSDK